jgi:4-hydroxybenzoyl-CoA reductase subunit beta
MPEFRVFRPRGLADAMAVRRDQPSSAFLAGGTDMLVNMRHGLNASPLLIDISGLAELNGIETESNGMRIGAGVHIATIEKHPLIASQYRALAEAAAAIAGPGHRRMGTLGGNLCLDTRCVYYNQSEWWRHANRYCLKERGDTCHVAPQGERCHATYSGDLAPALMALGAEIEIAGPARWRRIPLQGLYAEDGRAHLKLAAGELIVAVRLPAGAPNSSYAKVRVRDAIDYPLAGVAVALAMKDGKIDQLRVALTGTNSWPFVLEDTNSLLDQPVDEAMLRQIGRLVQKQVQPMRTTIASAQYRRLAAAGLASKLIRQLSNEADCVP